MLENWYVRASYFKATRNSQAFEALPSEERLDTFVPSVSINDMIRTHARTRTLFTTICIGTAMIQLLASFSVELNLPFVRMHQKETK